MLDADQLVRWAVRMQENDLDSPSLTNLASDDSLTFTEKLACFGKALAELGIDVPSTEEACMTIASQIAQEVLHAGRDAYDGAREIWWKLYNPNKNIKELRNFVGLVSEYEDQPSLSSYYEEQLRVEFRTLINNQTKQ